jgi:glutathione-regulated potassium-efflux system protein KefB
MAAHGFLQYALVFLLAIVIAVPLFQRLRLGAVLAYLVIGALIGPHALGLVRVGEGEFEVAELGIVILLFLIGLELSPARLWLMRRAVFAVGSLQVALSLVALAVGLAAVTIHWRLEPALIAGFALAMSSTAIGVQILAERRELGHVHGRNAVAVLLFQDVVAVPAIAILPLLSGDVPATFADTARGIAKVVVALAAVAVLGRYLMRPLFRWVASTQSVEAFTATALLVVLGTAQLTALAGLSLALGAFLAGLLLAESEFRHEIEAALEPFKGLLMGLFFIGVGLTVDWAYVGANGGRVLVAAIGLLAIKAGILYALGRRVADMDRAGALRLAALLAQGGEFAFVLLAVAHAANLLQVGARDLLMAVVVVSMAATPLLVIAVERWLARRAPEPGRPFDDIPDSVHARVIIAGFGRVGQIVARVLRAHHVPFTALEHSVEQVDVSRRFGNVIYYGDPSRPELLRAARADRAEVFVLATDDPEANVRTARLVKRLYPHLRVYARARNRQHAFRLIDLQLDAVVRESYYSSLVLARHVLEGLGVPTEQAAERVERFRKHDERLLMAQFEVRDDDAKLLQTSREALLELEQLFEADLRAETLPARNES